VAADTPTTDAATMTAVEINRADILMAPTFHQEPQYSQMGEPMQAGFSAPEDAWV
jgi:hypothetical protein